LNRSKRNSKRLSSKRDAAAAKPQEGPNREAEVGITQRPLAGRSEPQRPKLLLGLTLCFAAWLLLLIYLAIRVNS